MPRQQRAILGLKNSGGQLPMLRARQEYLPQMIANKQRVEDIQRSKQMQDRSYNLQKKQMKMKKKADKWGMYLGGATLLGNLYSSFRSPAAPSSSGSGGGGGFLSGIANAIKGWL
jgi:hypothetical protein